MNTGGAGRLNEAVDVATTNGVTGISWVFGNEWTEYTVAVATTGSYTANFRVSSPGPGQQVVLTIDGAAGCTVNVPSTDSYDAYTTVSAPLALPAGSHVIRLTYLVGGFGQNIDSFEILQTTTITVPTSVPIGVPTTLNPTMSSAQAASTAAAASSVGYAKLASKQAAWHAWSIPSRPDLVARATNARTAGLKSDGVTDNTPALQTLLNGLPAGSALYFPAGTYRINGPVRIDKAITLFGESGTVFDCSRATQNVFSLNGYGSASSTVSGVTITGLVIEGPGIETLPVMMRGKYLQNVQFSYVKFHNVGSTAIDVYFCTDVLVENCVFDNVFKTDEGYGVAVCDRSDRVLIRNNFFVTKGRHSFTTGTANPSLPVSEYVRQVIFENNYCENAQTSAPRPIPI